MKFRIKKIDGIGCYPQVKHGFFSKWKRIGRHNTGFGLYSVNDLNNPLCEPVALNQIEDYKHWIELIQRKPIYKIIECNRGVR